MRTSTLSLAAILVACTVLVACGTTDSAGSVDTGPRPDAAADAGDTGDSCPSDDDPRVRYLSPDPAGCAGVGCGDGDPFVCERGCGCIDTSCADWSSPLAQVASTSAAECARVGVECLAGGRPVTDDCACGCIYAPPTCPDPTDPAVSYVGTSPAECAVIDFDCASDFFDGPCGCGCIDRACEPDTSPLVQRVADSPAACADIVFSCADGGEPFSDACGCGCVYAPPFCPDPADPAVSYAATSPEACAAIDLACAGDTFDGPCGCGCLEPEGPVCEPESFALRYVITGQLCDDLTVACDEDGWEPFDGGACGCGCRVSACRADRVRGTSGLAEEFALAARCEFLVACASEPADGSPTIATFGELFPSASCGAGRAMGCPEGTQSSCEAYIEDVDPAEILAACEISTAADLLQILCGGDL
jgi:hypothetical protein